MIKKTQEAEKDRSERWLLTYADLITLLLIFFIVMYSMSTINAKKFEQVAQSLAIVFNQAGGRNATLDGGRAVIPGDKSYRERLDMQRMKERIQKMIAERNLTGKITTTLEERGLVVSIRDTVLFTSGSADLSEGAKEIVLALGGILASMPNALRIEGHTDNDPIHTAQFYSNWELSTARATNVLQLLIRSSSLEPERMSAAGYGEYKPVAPNDTPTNKARNRRVDIVLLTSAFNKFEPGKAPSSEDGASESNSEAP